MKCPPVEQVSVVVVGVEVSLVVYNPRLNGMAVLASRAEIALRVYLIVASLEMESRVNPWLLR